MREESVNFDETENLFIEGDNLEVLKLLQKAYFGKIKMIYIDPLYDTGNEFIYPDKFSETLETYLEYTGQKDSGRSQIFNQRRIFRALSLQLAKHALSQTLLRKKSSAGRLSIFRSIDDNEVNNLRHILNEIFGEENFR